MNYLEWTVETPDAAEAEIVVAALAELGFDGFEEAVAHLKACAPEGSVDTEAAAQLLRDRGLRYTERVVPPQNWNAEWEASFSPVVIDGFCTVRAAFHAPDPSVRYDILVTPKMSFGTGHHATTHLMMEQLRDLPVGGKSVLDFGTGTGVLAILAEKLGAEQILAIDNDAWAVDNAAENLEANGCMRIRLAAGSLEQAAGQRFDLLLANINRHILLRYFPDFEALALPGAKLVLSGLLVEDEPLLVAAGQEAGWHLEDARRRGNWLCLRFTRDDI